MSDKVRLRFAPSPTGFLHLGNLRSALFGYLLSKSWGGDFILRIEDTDQKREVEGAVEKLINITKWTGVEFKEGPHVGGPHAPYTQSERLDIYKTHYEQLLNENKAYRCFCTEERLTKMREDQAANKKAPRYDRCCRDLNSEEVQQKLAAGEKFVIRQKMPLEGEVVVYDELRGDIKFKCTELDDQVLIKSNGVPTYQFASVVDDHLMEITHVTRGDEWLSSYPKNYLLYQAFNWQAPKFIHLPLILNKEGGKLSKRQGDVFAEQYKDKGYLPEAIVNFLALLGWHPEDDQEICSLEKLEKTFNLKNMGSSPAIFDIEKLDYYNSYYIKQKSLDELFELTKPYLININKPEAYLKKVLALAQERMKKLSDVTELSVCFFKNKPEYEVDLLIWKTLTKEDVKTNLETIKNLLNSVSEENWTKEYLEQFIVNHLKTNNLKIGDYLWPLRVSLTGEKFSPGPFEVADVFGKTESLIRIDLAINSL